MSLPRAHAVRATTTATTTLPSKRATKHGSAQRKRNSCDFQQHPLHEARRAFCFDSSSLVAHDTARGALERGQVYAQVYIGSITRRARRKSRGHSCRVPLLAHRTMTNYESARVIPSISRARARPLSSALSFLFFFFVGVCLAVCARSPRFASADDNFSARALATVQKSLFSVPWS